MAAQLTATAFTGAKLQVKTQAKRTQVVAPCQASLRKNALAAGLLAAAIVIAPAARADLVEDLVAKSQANKALHDKQRLASSNANFARSRTVTDKTCSFPSNFLGCDIGEYAGNVAYIADEKKVECEGTAPGLCAGNMNATKYASR